MTNSSPLPIYPCRVLNFFECSYKSKDNSEEAQKVDVNGNGKEKEHPNFEVAFLFELSEIAFQLELVLGKAQSITQSNNTVYEANFETNKVKEIHEDNYGYSIPSIDYPLEEKLADSSKHGRK